jgi:hypothetical protein
MQPQPAPKKEEGKASNHKQPSNNFFELFGNPHPK